MWDQYNLIAIIDENDNLQKSMLWGEDLSGSLQGAGGVGGLLAVTDHNASKSYLPCYDGNGNVMAYVDSADGSIEAEYEYDPFGRTIVKSGSMADDFVYRFSTKPVGFETGLVYYGFRYLNTEIGRWISRDPLGEEDTLGNFNLIYAFSSNNMISHIDSLGLEGANTSKSEECICGPEIKQNLINVLKKVEQKFKSWTKKQKIAAREYVSRKLKDENFPLEGGGYAMAALNGWDIVDLHEPDWLAGKQYKGCAQGQGCEKTVMVDGKCFYAGSVNYVVFGKMEKLLKNYFHNVNPHVGISHSKLSIGILISAWKGPIRVILENIRIDKLNEERLKKDPNAKLKPYVTQRDISTNLKMSRTWAHAGFDGWPAVATPDAEEDYKKCKTTCDKNCNRAFKFYWYPNTPLEGL